MIEWTVDIDTPEGITSDENELVRFRESLEGILGMTGAAASINTRSGQLSAAFGVVAPDAVRAADMGVAAFVGALEASGLPKADPARVTVERAGAGETVPA